MSSNHKVEALTVVVRQFLTDGMDTEEACNTDIFENHLELSNIGFLLEKTKIKI